MENAAQALVIAAGMIVAVMLISLVLYVKQKMSQPIQTREDLIRNEQIQEHNRKFMAYNQKLLQGGQVLSILNYAYDQAVSLEGMTFTKNGKEYTSVKARKKDTNVNEPIVNIRVELKDSNFSGQIRYYAAEFENGFISKTRQNGPVEFGGKTLSELLGVKTENLDVKSILDKKKLDGPEFFNFELGNNNVIEVFTINPSNPDIINITDEIFNFIDIGGSLPSIIKKNSVIEEDKNNWKTIQYTTPANEFIKRTFECDDTSFQYDRYGYITSMTFKEID